MFYNVYADVLKQISETMSQFSKTLCITEICLLTVLPDVGRGSVFESMVKDILYLT